MSLDKLSLVWNPDWFHRHESLWSIASKLTWANIAKIPAICGVLQGLLGAGGLWRPGQKHRAYQLVSALELLATEARTAFLWDLAPQESDIGLVSTTIRYCRSCLKNAYHSVLFQLIAVQRCPVHNEELVDYCPRCGHPLTPNVDAPWACVRCGHILVHLTGLDFLEVFRRGAETGAFDQLREALSASTPHGSLDAAYVNNPATYRAFVAGNANTVELTYPSDIHDADFDYWASPSRECRLARWYGEEWVYLLSTAFAAHLKCAEAVQYGPWDRKTGELKTTCPVGWALAQAAEYSCIPLAADRWIEYTAKMGSGVAQVVIPELFDRGTSTYLNEAAAPVVVRAVARTVMADALFAYASHQDAAVRPWCRQASKFWVTWATTEAPGGWRLTAKTNADLVAIANLVSRARCPR